MISRRTNKASGKPPVLVAFDTETTGFPPAARIVEIGALAFCPTARGKVHSRFHTLVNPQRPIPAAATTVHGITDRMVRDAPTAAEVLPQFLKWLPRDAILVAHNARFDVEVLGAELLRARLRPPKAHVSDTVRLARMLAETPDNKLQTIAAHHRWNLIGEAHRAASDADLVRRLFLRAYRKLGPAVLNATRPFRMVERTVNEQLPSRLGWLEQAITTRTSVVIDYVDRYGQRTRREVMPQSCSMVAEGTAGFFAFCQLRGEMRYFYTDRVVKVRAIRRRGSRREQD